VSRAAHPARSLDFLSRLHDGELTAAERAHFESHRAHCDECRRAASEFEATLAYYRASGTPPPPSDLAGRILRRLERASPRRRPFGVVFGIDLKWAGAFMAALVVTILGYSVLDRKKAEERIRVSFPESPRLASANPAAETPPGPSRQVGAAVKKSSDVPFAQILAPAEAPAPTPASTADERLEAARPLTSKLEAKAPEPAAPPAAVPVRAAPLSAPAARAHRSEAGGESGSADKNRRSRADQELDAAGALSNSAPEKQVEVRLILEALDGFGTPPSVVNDPEVELRAEDRGRYLVTVGANGIPFDVRREDRTTDALAKEKDRGSRTLETLRKLRFTVADRPRRLLVRVE
jgi:hypothetical protein